MEKKTLLKSVYIGIQEDGTPGEAQIQRVERWTGLPEGAVIPDTYLPLERFAVLSATDEERTTLEAVLGEVAHGHAEQAQTWQQAHGDVDLRLGEAELARDNLTAERDGLLGQKEGLTTALEQAQAGAEQFQVQLDTAHGQLAEAAEVQAQLEAAQAEIVTLTALVTDLRGQVEIRVPALEQELAQARTQVNEQAVALGKADSEAVTLREQLDSQAAALEQATGEAAALREQIAALKLPT